MLTEVGAFHVIFADLYARHTTGLLRWALQAWFVLVVFSTVLTAQHHVADTVGGFAIATVYFCLFRYEETLPS